ncbi:DUF943 family protein [Cedecea neteri]|uniref:DUF943 family protein n=1 Tax=Cedecea neteri TaxID=158822 RepID=UPI0028936B72|nr:DUF943 family protein [Cedecea neteri]WNJ79774.1 DUF943 family protein [Cedecea neteri]
MTFKNKKVLSLLVIASCVLAGYLLWESLRPVEIVAVHHRNRGFSDILVTHFPYTDKGKINWWLENKSALKYKYNIPDSGRDNYFNITFWLFGDGYKEEGKYDRLCFNDMKSKENCIEKDAVFSVSNSINLGTIFVTYDGEYQLRENGDIVNFDNNYEVR